MKPTTLLALLAVPLTGCLVGDAGPLPWSGDYSERIRSAGSTIDTAKADIVETMDDGMATNPTIGAIAAYYAASTTTVYDFNTGEPVRNAVAKLERRSGSHDVEEYSKSLPAGHVVTLFYVAFPSHENGAAASRARSRCSRAGLSHEAAARSRRSADSAVASGDGKAHFERLIGLGLRGAPGEVVFGNGLTNPRKAEIHLLTRDKGLPISGKVTLQKTTFDGGCDVSTCVDAQFAIFKAPGY